MAIYYLGMKTFGRSRGKHGSRAPSAAAYRSGERIRDERTGRVYDHSRRTDVIHKEIILPTQLAAQRSSLGWALDRTTLWNAAEHAELRRNSRVAREFVVALPHELAPAARMQLASRFGQEIADRYRSAVDLAIHAPRGDARNYHAHLLTTTREITPDGLGRKTSLELSGTRRHELGLPRWREEIGFLRERWANHTNTALELAHVATRVTHLSAAERGLGPSNAPPRVPIAAYHMEKRGVRSFIGEKIRERHRADLERAKAGPGRQALVRSESERRDVGHPSIERASRAIGRSMLRDIGAGVRAAWRELHGRFGVGFTAAKITPSLESNRAAREVAPAPESNRAPVPTDKGSVAPFERSVERSHQMANGAELRAEALAPSARIDDLAAQSARNWLAYRERHQVVGIDEAARSARNWLAYREEQRARQGAGLDAGVDGSGRADAPKSGAEQRGRGQEPGPSLEREHNRRHDNDFSL